MKLPYTVQHYFLLAAALLTTCLPARAVELGPNASSTITLGELELTLSFRPQDVSSGQWKNVPVTWETVGDTSKGTLSFVNGTVVFTRAFKAQDNGASLQDSWQGSAEKALLMSVMDVSSNDASRLTLKVGGRTQLLSERLRPILETSGLELSLTGSADSLKITSSAPIRLQVMETSTGQQIRLLYNRPEDGVHDGSVILTIEKN